MYDDDGRWIDDFGGTYYSNGKYLGNYNSYDEYAAEHCTYSQINIGVIRIIIGMFAGIVALIVQIIAYYLFGRRPPLLQAADECRVGWQADRFFPSIAVNL